MNMQPHELEQLAQQLLAGSIDVAKFVGHVLQPASAPLGDVTLDLDRVRRCGYPEVIFGQGKSVEAVAAAMARLQAAGQAALVTRLEADKAHALRQQFPLARYNPLARTMRLGDGPRGDGHVAIVTAGSSDRPVAEEALETVEWMGASTRLVQDVGVAGPHRLPEQLPAFREADVVVVVAGMEGALPSVVGGHVACPVIAVPTSVGYGASFGGLAALLGMLNSCAANVTVVNIDAGFKGGYLAGLIAGRTAARRQTGK
jgi:pyridinium-3,5-biscarboxylic acid mononucleotide synthase